MDSESNIGLRSSSNIGFFGGGYSIGRTICIIFAVVIVTLIIIAFLLYITDNRGKLITPGVKRRESYYNPRSFRESARTKKLRDKEGNANQITKRIERLTRELRQITEPGEELIERTYLLTPQAQVVNDINRQIENDYTIALELMEGDIVMNLIAPQQAMHFIAQAFAFMPHLHSNRQVVVAADKIAQEAANKAETRIEAVNAAMKSSVVYNNDTQSSHDNKAIRDLRDIHQKLEQSTVNILPFDQCMAEMIVWIDKNMSRDKTDKAMQTINIIANGYPISAIGKTETQIFSLMYSHCKEFDERKNSDNNAEQRSKFDAEQRSKFDADSVGVAALANALVDCVEVGNVVCASGRTARVLNCLAGISEELGAARTHSALRDEIMHRMINEFNALVQQYKNSDDATNIAIADTYLHRNAPDVTDTTAMQKWRKDVNDVIDSVLNEYQNRLTQAEIQAMRDECRIYASI